MCIKYGVFVCVRDRTLVSCQVICFQTQEITRKGSLAPTDKEFVPTSSSYLHGLMCVCVFSVDVCDI